MILARDVAKLCGRPVDIRPVGEDESDLVYCGLHLNHSGAHMAIVWWYDDPGEAPASTEA